VTIKGRFLAFFSVLGAKKGAYFAVKNPDFGFNPDKL